MKRTSYSGFWDSPLVIKYVVLVLFTESTVYKGLLKYQLFAFYHKLSTTALCFLHNFVRPHSILKTVNTMRDPKIVLVITDFICIEKLGIIE